MTDDNTTVPMLDRIATVIDPDAFAKGPIGVMGSSAFSARREAARMTAVAIMKVMMDATPMMLTHGHADGVRKDGLWMEITPELARKIQAGYLPTAYRAMLAVASGDR